MSASVMPTRSTVSPFALSVCALAVLPEIAAPASRPTAVRRVTFVIASPRLRRRNASAARHSEHVQGLEALVEFGWQAPHLLGCRRIQFLRTRDQRII